MSAFAHCGKHLQGGNNNTYCHDSPLNWFNWEQAAADTKGFARYFRCLVNFRCGSPGILRSHAQCTCQPLSAAERGPAALPAMCTTMLAPRADRIAVAEQDLSPQETTQGAEKELVCGRQHHSLARYAAICC